MSEILTFSPEDMFHQLRTFGQIPNLTEKIIVREIIARACNSSGITVEPDELQQTVDAWRLTHQLDSIEATQLWLQKHHLSLEELGNLISTTILSSKLAQHLFGERVKPYFLDYQLDYMQAAMYEIVFDDEGIAMEISYAIDEGEISFFEAATLSIQDTELARIGGYRGRIYRKGLKPEISAAVFAATPPQILKPIVTPSGVHLIKVEEIIQPQLDAVMYQKILSDLFDNWLLQQMKEFEVKINFPSYQPSDLSGFEPAMV